MKPQDGPCYCCLLWRWWQVPWMIDNCFEQCILFWRWTTFHVSGGLQSDLSSPTQSLWWFCLLTLIRIVLFWCVRLTSILHRSCTCVHYVHYTQRTNFTVGIHKILMDPHSCVGSFCRAHPNLQHFCGRKCWCGWPFSELAMMMPSF